MKPTLLLLLALLLATPLVRAQSLDEVLSGTEAEDSTGEATTPVAPTRLVVADEARVLANGTELSMSAEEIQLEREKVYDVQISQVKPFSHILVEFFKAGVLAGRKRFLTNENGEYLFEYTTPKQKVAGKARISYTSSSGKAVVHEVRVLLR